MPARQRDDAAIARALRDLGLDPSPADLALAIPAIVQIEAIAREVHERLARSPHPGTGPPPPR